MTREQAEQAAGTLFNGTHHWANILCNLGLAGETNYFPKFTDEQVSEITRSVVSDVADLLILTPERIHAAQSNPYPHLSAELDGVPSIA